MHALWRLTLAGITVLTTACSSTPTTRGLVQEAAAAMGGLERLQGVQTLTLRGGEGPRHHLGQSLRAGAPDPPRQLTEATETADLAGGRAAYDYRFQTASGGGQHRQEVLTRLDGRLIAIQRIAGRPVAVTSPSGILARGMQNSPEWLLRRNVVTIVRAAALSAPDERVQERQLDGRTYLYGTAALDAEEVGLYFDPATRLLAAFETTDTEAMLGDVPALYRLDDYRPADGLQLPHRITIHKGGEPYADMQFASIAVNDPAAADVFAIPEEETEDAKRAVAAGDHYSPVALESTANGVYFVRAYSHHSMVVEFPTWLVVVEAPYTEAQSHTLVRELERRFPGKPVRYVVVSHHHYDHVGGVRGLAAHGATILTARGNEPFVRSLVQSAHTNPPDELERRRQAGRTTGSVETFEDRHVISDGGQSLQLHAISGNPHVDPAVIVYVPGARTLFQSDLFFPGIGSPASPAAVHLLQAVRDRNLRVDTHIGGHGEVAPFSELEQTVAAAGKN